MQGLTRNVSTCENTITLEVTWQGTHTGTLQTPQGPIPPTGKQIALHGVLVADVEGDRFTSTRNYFDLMTLMNQIGATTSAGVSTTT